MAKYLVNPANVYNQVVTEVPGGITLKPGQVVEFDEPTAALVMNLYPKLLAPHVEEQPKPPTPPKDKEEKGKKGKAPDKQGEGETSPEEVAQ